MNIIATSDDDDTEADNGGTYEENGANGRRWVAYVRVGSNPTSPGNLVIRGYGTTQLTAINNCQDKAVAFGQLVSMCLHESFGALIPKLREDTMRELAKEHGYNLDGTSIETPEDKTENNN